MGALMRSIDWSNTPIGPVESWSPTLRTMLRLLLVNRLPMVLWWGPDFIQFYNDPFWFALGARHLRSMGQPASECWAEIWHIIGPPIETPFRGGDPTWMDDIFLELNRKGFVEETHWTIAYSPVLDDSAPGGIGGVIGTLSEISKMVVAERRLSLLCGLGARSSEATTAEDACAIAAESFGQHKEDVPFALLYLLSDDRKYARLAGAVGVAIGQAEGNLNIDLSAEPSSDQPWPLAEALRSEAMQVVEDLQSKLSNVPAGPWSDPPRSAVVCPVPSNIAHQLAGLLVMGISSRLVFDERHRGFCELVTSQIAMAIANARANRGVLEREPSLRKAAQAAAGAQVETILDSITDQLFAFSTDWRFTYLNPRAAEQMLALGKDPEAVVGQVLWDVFPDPPNEQALRRVMTERVSVTDELFYAPLGEWVENHIWPSADGGIVTFQRYITGRKQTEWALQVSEERFRRYFELGLIGMAITSPAKGCVEVNDELCRILGYEREELLRMSWADITHPDDLAADIANFNRVIAGEIDGYSMDKRWIRKDSRIIDSTMAAKCVRRADGSVNYFIGLVEDITERKRVEAALRRSEANLAEGQRISHTGSWAWNAASEEMFCSQEFLRIFGLDAGTAHPTHETFLQLIHPADVERVRQTFERAVETSTAYEAEYRVVRPDGALRHIHNQAYPVFNESGALLEYVGTAVDITARKRAEEKLGESERRFRLLVESIPHHVWSFRPDGSLGYWNQRLSDYTGLSDDELRRGGWAALHPDDVARAREKWQEAWAQGAEYLMEERLRGRDGRYRRFVCRAVPVKDEQGRPAEWFGTNSDVENFRQADEALHKLQAELAHVARVTTLGELAASIAHEVNQPLTAVITGAHACARWLASEPPNLAEANSTVQRIVRDANRAAEVIARIRAFLQRGAAQAAVDINEVIAQVVAMARGEIRTQGVTLVLAPAAGLPPIVGDRIQLQQVILNLVINGIDAMSQVTKRTRTLEIEAGRHGVDALRVAVRDSGVGLPSGHRDRIFEAFHTTKPHGMGMGLAISRSIVEAHGGTLWASPNDGPGTTFQFTLPVAPMGI
jgi:PAS domain S-box-containing protein